MIIFLSLLNSNLPFENNEITKEKIIAGFVLIFIYFIPSIIARDKFQFKFIFFLNLLIGWTGIGWLIALFWGIKAKSKAIESIDLEEDLD